jgi:hypothetical protein
MFNYREREKEMRMNLQDAIEPGEWVRLTERDNGEPAGTRGKFEGKVGNYFQLRVNDLSLGLYHPLCMEKISIDEVSPNMPYEVIETLKDGPSAGTIVLYYTVHHAPKTAEFVDGRNTKYAIPFANLKKFEQQPWK